MTDKHPIKEIAEETWRYILTFIARDIPRRISPDRYSFTSITIEDLYEIESVIQADKEKEGAAFPRNLDLIVHTPWWEVYAATKIAIYLRSMFEWEIDVYVPYQAASWGTMLSLIANEIVMDNIGNLTPIDVQIPYNETRISSCTYKQVVEFFEEKFPSKRPTEIPTPFYQMINKLDPVIYYEISKIEKEQIRVAESLIRTHMKEEEYKKANEIATNLVSNSYVHEHVINKDEAIKIWLPISTDEKKLKYLQYYKNFVKFIRDKDFWVSNHFILSFLPTGKDVNNTTWEETTNNDEWETTNDDEWGNTTE